MANEFFGFGQLTRPDIGLLADNIQNLAEIYTSDQPDALKNISLRPEVLDIIHEVSETIGAEDLRATSDLSTLLLTTLHLQFETLERIEENIFDDGIYASTLDRIGLDSSNISITGNQSRAEHSIIFNGAIQCYGAKYRENKLSDTSLFTPKVVNSFISTSRASLLGSEKDDSNHFASASFPGSIRVRKRSHVNTIKVNPLSFTPAPAVVEQPSKMILCKIKNGGTEVDASLLATANSPLKIPCSLNKGKIIFKFNTRSVQSFYGVQIQPQVSKPGSPPRFLAQDPQQQNLIAPGDYGFTHTVNIDISATGYQDTFDLYMYLYVNPDAVTEITFEGIEIKDFFDKKDFGLIGFNNLEKFSFGPNGSGGRSSSFTILPIWLKTLSTKLKTFEIANTGDTWYNKSQMKYFDYRENNITGSAFDDLPRYTMAGYLSIPKKGVTVDVLGTDFNGGGTEKFAKYIQSAVSTGTNIPTSGGSATNGFWRDKSSGEFREFNAMTTLNLGWRVLGKNARLDDVFPNLTSITWVGGRYRQTLEGTPPKISNHGNQILSYNINYNVLNGASIYDIGTAAADASVTSNATGPGSLCHISKYNIKSFNISGRHHRSNLLSGAIGGRPGQESTASSPLKEAEWETWYNNTQAVDVDWCSNIEFNLQPSTRYWQALTTLRAKRTKIYFRGATGGGIDADPFKMPLVTSIDLEDARVQSGVLPSMSKNVDGADFVRFDIEAIRDLTLFTENSESYLFPSNFASGGGTNGYKLKEIIADETDSRYNPAHGVRLRKGMFDECPELTTIRFNQSHFTGEFINIPSKKNPDEEQGRKAINVQIFDADFHSLKNLSIQSGGGYTARDLTTLTAYRQNLEQGGCILPDFGGITDSAITSVRLDSSLPSTYPNSWEIGSYQAGDIIEDSDASTNLTGITYTKVSNTDDEFYYISGPSNLKRKVLVNDNIIIGGEAVGTVISVYNDRVYVDTDLGLTGSSNALTFSRATKDISNWFSTGFSSLKEFRAPNCRLSGILNIRPSLYLTNQGGRAALDLAKNNIEDVEEITWDRVFSGGNRSLTVNLSSNNLSASSIQKSIRKLYEIVGTTEWSRGRVILSGNKKVNGRYTSYTQNDLFPVTEVSAPSQEVNLTRQEEIKVYKIVTTTDENGNETTTRVQEGTRFVTVPGENVSNTYYGKKLLNRTATRENADGIKFRTMRLRIDLGFTYKIPQSGSTIIGETYLESFGTGDTGRLASAREALGSSFQLTDFA